MNRSDQPTEQSKKPSQPPAPGACSDQGRVLLALSKVSGLGPVRILRLLDRFGTPDQIFNASHAQLCSVEGIGKNTATSVLRDLSTTLDSIEHHLSQIADANAHVISIVDPAYPPLLKQIPSPPPVLMVRGHLDYQAKHRYGIAMVGSRSSSVYGMEQAHRFSSALAQSGLTIISGGARGIDSASHRGALQVQGQTCVVLGCGIARTYPPENAELFQQVVDQGGAIISELPVHANPDAKNFPARNRIISGLALGVLVIEAGLKSGSLITARVAIEDQGREVMGLPGRVDSKSSEGTNQLLKQGAHVVTEPADVISILEQHAYHLHAGTHEAMTQTSPSSSHTTAQGKHEPRTKSPNSDLLDMMSDEDRAVYVLLDQPRTCDELAEMLHRDPGAIRSQMTILEIQGRVTRSGSRFIQAR